MNTLTGALSIRYLQAQAAWKAYRGEYRRTFKVKPGSADPNVKANYAKIVVTKTVTSLFGNEPSFDVVDDEETGETGRLKAAQKYLDRAWKHNNKMAFLQKAGINAAVNGDCFIHLADADPYPRLVNLNPMLCDVVTNPNDYEDAWSYTYSWEGTDQLGQPVPMRRTWTKTESGWWDRIFELFEQGPSLISELYLDQPFPPIFHWQNLPNPTGYFGEPDLTPDIIHMMERINGNLSNWNKMALQNASPRPWGSGFEADDLKQAPDETLVLPNKDAKLGLLEMKTDATVVDLLHTRLKETLYETARMPEIATGKMQNIGVLSGLALHILYQPLLEATGQKRTLCGPPLEQLSEAVLWLGGFKNLSVSVEWPDLLPSDPQLAAQVLQADQELGIVSRETASKKRGYDPSKEAARIKREAGGNDNAN